MLVFYCRDFVIARNVIIGFVLSGVIVTILSICGVTVNGTIFFCVILGLALAYTSLAMLHHRIQKFLITISFALVSVLFLFSVNFVFGNVLEAHQQTRIKVSLGIEEDLRGAGYNVNQSKIAIGSGGVIGKGFLNGTQTKLKYVPEQHTDFIFCTIGEEEGFVGAYYCAYRFPCIYSATNSNCRKTTHCFRTSVCILHGIILDISFMY